MNHKHVPMIRNQPDLAAATDTAAVSQIMPRNNHLASPSGAEPESGPDWRRIASAMLRFRWLIALAVALGLSGAFAATRVLRPIYKAQANVWVDVPQRYTGDRVAEARGPIRQGALLEADDWVELLRSYIVLDQVVRNQRLYVNVQRLSDRPLFATFNVTDTFRPGEYKLAVKDGGRAYTLTGRDGMELEQGTVGDSIGRRLGFRWAPPPESLPGGRTLEFSLLAPRDAAGQLGEQLATRMDLNGNFLAIELRGTNPSLIAAILNAVTERYVTVAAQLKREKLTELTKILEDQLSTAQGNLDQAETALSRFRTRTITLPSEQPAADGAAGVGGTGGGARAATRVARSSSTCRPSVTSCVATGKPSNGSSRSNRRRCRPSSRSGSRPSWRTPSRS